MTTRSLKSKLLAALVTGSLCVTSLPARAFIVYDPANHAQNLLTALRTLIMINNQLQQLRNEARELTNWARNLNPLTLTVGPQVQAALTQIRSLKANLQGIKMDVASTQSALTNLFPSDLSSLTRTGLDTAARQRLQVARDAAQSAMQVQAQVSDDLDADATMLNDLMQRSYKSGGALEATQVGNELTAFNAKQVMALTQVISVQGRETSVARARDLELVEQGRVMRQGFLGSACAYSKC